jgi:hypothetical protein
MQNLLDEDRKVSEGLAQLFKQKRHLLDLRKGPKQLTRSELTNLLLKCTEGSNKL